MIYKQEKYSPLVLWLKLLSIWIVIYEPWLPCASLLFHFHVVQRMPVFLSKKEFLPIVGDFLPFVGPNFSTSIFLALFGFYSPNSCTFSFFSFFLTNVTGIPGTKLLCIDFKGILYNHLHFLHWSFYTRWDSDFKPYLLDMLLAWMYPMQTFISLYSKIWDSSNWYHSC